MTIKYPLALASVFIWIGFVGAISFMEAWLKFQAPGIDLPLGLGIGRLVFHALNKVEWVLALLAITNMVAGRTKMFTVRNLFFILPIAILLIQTFSTLPILDARAQMHIDGLDVPPSNAHFLYVAMEVVKVASLFIFGIKLLKT
ncbi:MAG: hypothetical protein ACR2MT_01385 [Aurantibacter sp.]